MLLVGAGGAGAGAGGAGAGAGGDSAAAAATNATAATNTTAAPHLRSQSVVVNFLAKGVNHHSLQHIPGPAKLPMVRKWLNDEVHIF